MNCVGEQEFLIQRKYPMRELKKKHRRIAEVIAPLLKNCGPDEFRKAKEEVEELFLKRKSLNRRSLFSTLHSLGFEPSDARQTLLFEVVPGLVPLRTIQEAWNLVEENLGLVNMAIRYGARRGSPSGPSWEDKRGIVVRRMFDNALYWEPEKGAFSTYVFSCAGSSGNEMDKMIGPYLIPHTEVGLMGIIAEERAKNPGISNSGLADKLGICPERIRVLDIGRASRSASGMDHGNIFYSTDPEDGGQQKARRIAYSELDSASAPPSPEAWLEQEGRKARIEEAVSSLPGKYAEVIRHAFGIGTRRMGARELSESLGMDVSRAKNLLERALAHLRRTKAAELLELMG